ncbi:MAG: DUF192 domain-containing protein [Bacteroidetes bacterium]|nr:DUF192 domain-containing protein [Bacteroidota bacterium]
MTRFSSATILSLLVFAAVLSSACGKKAPSDDPVVTDVPFRTDGSLTFQRIGANGELEAIQTISIEIADTDTLRMRGLMDRQHIPFDRGMLFIFPFAETQSFWMANTQSSLDIMFVSSDSVINDIHKYTKPLSSAQVTGSDPAQFVVEVAAGFADNEGVNVGDRITWTKETTE